MNDSLLQKGQFLGQNIGIPTMHHFGENGMQFFSDSFLCFCLRRSAVGWHAVHDGVVVLDREFGFCSED